MPNSPTSRSDKHPSDLPQENATPEREPRGARRKRETRARLLEAALRLMAEKGAEGVAINEITEAADVGFGSFYNHFESKEAIYAALVDLVFEDFADTLDRCAAELSDPAEVISVSVRHTLMRARREPVWGQFLIREGLSSRALSQGLGQRLLRDMQKGAAAGRFEVKDPLVSVLSLGGAVLATIAADLQFSAPSSPTGRGFADLGFGNENLPERIATALLRSLGLAHAEAEEIANRALPAVSIQAKTP